MNAKIIIICIVCFIVGAISSGIGCWIFLRGTIADAKIYNNIKDDYKRIKDNESATKELLQSTNEYFRKYQTAITDSFREFGKLDSQLDEGSGIIRKQSEIIDNFDAECRKIESIFRKSKAIQSNNN